MSIGYGGYMNLVQADDTILMYMYCCYNINIDGWMIYQNVKDGEIVIDRDALVEPEIHIKLKRMPSGRKHEIVKRVRCEVNYSQLLSESKITIKNASGTWKMNPDGVDMIALKMIYKLFEYYQDTGSISEHVSLFC